MFVLTELRDIVHVEPRDLGKPYHQAILDHIDKKYANRVIINIGLCIRTFDLLHIDEPFIAPGEGTLQTRVHFRMIVFRPFKGEVFRGKIRACTTEGVLASVGFFSDIVIPSSMLPEPREFNHEEQLWVWKCGGGDIFMDLEEEIVMKVNSEVFREQVPKPAGEQPSGGNSEVKPPYQLICEMNEAGLGCPRWWT